MKKLTERELLYEIVDLASEGVLEASEEELQDEGDPEELRTKLLGIIDSFPL